jgi:hypothetical protein
MISVIASSILLFFKSYSFSALQAGLAADVRHEAASFGRRVDFFLGDFYGNGPFSYTFAQSPFARFAGTSGFGTPQSDREPTSLSAEDESSAEGGPKSLGLGSVTSAAIPSAADASWSDATLATASVEATIDAESGRAIFGFGFTEPTPGAWCGAAFSALGRFEATLSDLEVGRRTATYFYLPSSIELDPPCSNLSF